MKQPAELQAFLQTHSAEGEHQSEGQLTIARDAALSKLAEFQLPFAGAWALKVIQAAVAERHNEGIRVFQTRSETRFHFRLSSKWSLDEIEKSLYEPSPSESTSVQHLLHALWAVGVGERRAFQLSLPCCQESLFWTGDSLIRMHNENTNDWLTLVVQHRRVEQRGIVSRLDFRIPASRNAEVCSALANFAFTCPIPLMLDRRRLDGFQNCPRFGFGHYSQPLALGICSGELDPLPIPARTFGDGPRINSAAGVYLVTYHTEYSHQKSQATRPKRTKSVCFWVKDGVIVDQDEYPHRRSPAALGSFLNAEGLEADLTTMRLRVSEARSNRLSEAGRMIGHQLVCYSDTNLATPKPRERILGVPRGKRFTAALLLPQPAGAGGEPPQWVLPILGWRQEFAEAANSDGRALCRRWNHYYSEPKEA